MKTGDMRTRITFQDYETSYNVLNEPIKSWNDFVTVWADVQIQTGKEYWGAKKLNEELDGTMKIRYNHNITALMRAPYDGKIYQITAVIHDIKKSWTKLYIKAVE